MRTEEIESTLTKLDELYELNNDSFQLNVLSKVATLELSGWVEETHDDLIQQFLDRRAAEFQELKSEYCLINNKLDFTFQSYFKTAYIEKVHGCSYANHFRPLLINLLGYFQVIEMEKFVGLTDIQTLRSTLGDLHKARSNLAHQSIPNLAQQSQLSAPSIVRNQYYKIKPILQKIEIFLSRL